MADDLSICYKGHVSTFVVKNMQHILLYVRSNNYAYVSKDDYGKIVEIYNESDNKSAIEYINELWVETSQSCIYEHHEFF